MQKLTQTEMKKIREVPFDKVKNLMESDSHGEIMRWLALDFEDLTVGGEACGNALLNVYALALQNATGNAVTAFLCGIDDTDVFHRLTTGVFLDLAAAQKKKTAFEKIIDAEARRRRKQEKADEKNRKTAERAAFRAQQPPYYGKKLTQHVVETILSEQGLQVRLNLVTKKIELHGNTDSIHALYSKDNIMSTLPTLLLDVCKKNEVGGQVSLGAINAYLFNLADANRYNPIQDMLKKHRNSEPRHLEKVYEILGLQKRFDKLLVKKWLVQTVAFAFGSFDNPVSTEGVLVLQGEQGNGKTSFFRKLAGNPLWFTEGAVIDMRNKDSVITAISSWICELGEIDSTLKKEQSALKAFITRTVDKIRLPYAAAESDMPRTTSMCGTVNPEQFLKDNTGNRRYWTVHVDKIDKKRLHALTQQEIFDIWGYIYDLYLQDENGFRLTDKEFQTLEINNRDYAADLPLEQEVRDLFDFSIAIDYWRWVSPAELTLYVHNAKAEQIGRVLSKMCKEERDVEKRRSMVCTQYKMPLKGCIRQKLTAAESSC